jgi:hypothetical protein
MPLCGFNSTILKGLTLFAKGLYEQALKRSKEDEVSIERVFEIEIKEMAIFLVKLKELRPAHSVLKGLTLFAKGLYEQALKRSKKDKISIKRAFKAEIKEMNSFLPKLDKIYYEKLRPTHSVDKAMEKLVAWIKKYFKKPSK